MGRLWAIILAAGESRRMGFPKMLLQFDGMTMIEKVIDNVTKSAVDETLVVLGAGRDDIIKLIARAPVTHCYNDNYKEGMLSSVQCGFRKLPDGFEAALVFQGDQPLISPDVINEIIGAYRSSGMGIVMPVCEKRRGHPLLIDGKYKDEIERLDAREGLRSLAYQFSDDVLEVVTEDKAVLMDFDTYNDYKKEINQKR